MNRSLRIIQVINVRWYNATAWYALKISKLLKDAGHEVLVLALPGTDTFKKAQEMGLDPKALNLNSTKPHRLIFAFIKLVAIIKKFNPDIINCHRGEGFVYFGLLKVLGFSFALVRTRGDQRAPKAGFINILLHKRLSQAVIATNSKTLKKLKEILKVPDSKLHCIIGGVDREKFKFSPEGRKRLRAELGVKDDELLVGLLGRFDQVKGQMELIYAMSQLKKKIPNARLMLAGFPAGVTQEMIDGWARDAEIKDIVYAGYSDDVPACLSAMDIGVMASIASEAIARSAVEMMSCSLPVVGTDVGVMPDLLPAEARVPPGRVGALATLIRTYLEDAEKLRSLQEICLERIKSLDERSFLEASLDVYNKALKKDISREE